MQQQRAADGLKIGWASTEILPPRAVLVAGQFHARVSEGVGDPLTATVLVLDSGADHAVLVSCDLVAISEELLATARARAASEAAGLTPEKIVLNATHTHTAPEIRPPRPESGDTARGTGVDLPVMSAAEYVAFAGERIGQAVVRAWRSRAAGRVAFGLGCAVIGRNRRWVDMSGKATMYGNTDSPGFERIEGYEDHSLNLLATYDPEGKLTGLVVNVPCSSQVSEAAYALSADYWHETRAALRERFGESIFVLAQCSAAGDQSPHLLYEKPGWKRMLELHGRTPRQEIAHRIAQAVAEVLPVISKAPVAAPVLCHRVERMELPMNRLTEEDVRTALQDAETWRAKYEEEKRKLEQDPALRNEPRWYVRVTEAYRRMGWHQGVARRFEMQKTRPLHPVEAHVIRLGDVAIATNPFEYYLDFGVFIKARSRAVQTFLVELAGPGTYVPSARSTAGGGYGSVPASNPVGPEGGRRLAERTIEIIRELWAEA